MEKKNLVATCMAVPFGIMFSLGMVLALVAEWNTFIAGIIVGSIGLLGLIAIYPVYRKVGKYPPLKSNPKVVVAIIIGVVGCLLLGVGMCLVMVPTNPKPWQIIVGILVGMIGLVITILNPIINLNKKNNEQTIQNN